MLASDSEEPESEPDPEPPSEPEPLPLAPVELDPELVPPVVPPDPPPLVAPSLVESPSLMDSLPLDVDELVGAPPSGPSGKPRAAPLPHPAAATANVAPRAADAPIACTKLISRSGVTAPKLMNVFLSARSRPGAP